MSTFEKMTSYCRLSMLRDQQVTEQVNTETLHIYVSH